MAVAFRSGASSGNATQVSTASVSVPSGAASGDIAVVYLGCWQSGSTPTITPPSGFTLKGAMWTSADNNARCYVYWKRLTGGDTGTYDFALGATFWTTAQCALFSGCATTGDPWGAVATPVTGTFGTVTTQSVTLVDADGGLFWAVYNDSSGTHTPPTNFTEIADADSGSCAYRIPGSSGSQSSASGSISSSSNAGAWLGALLSSNYTPPNAPTWVADRFAAGNITAATTTSAALSSPTSIATGNYLIARIAVDNSGSSGAAPGCTVTDPRSNSWTVLGPSLADPGAASAGATAYLAYAKVTTAYQTSDSLTFNWGGVSTTAEAIVVEEWTNIHASSPVAVTETTNNSGSAGSTTAVSVSITPTAADQTVITCLASEGPIGDSFTGDSDTTNGLWLSLTRVASASGTAASNQCVAGQYKQVTASGAQTWNATITSRDWAAIAVVFAPAVTSTTGALAGTAPMPTGAIPATVTQTGALAGVVPMPTGTLTSATETTGALAGVVPMPSGALTGTVEPPAPDSNQAPIRPAPMFFDPARAAHQLSGTTTVAAAVAGALAGTTPMPSGALTETQTFSGSNGSAWPSPWTGPSGATVDQQDGHGRLVTAASTFAQAFIRRPAPDNAELLFKWQAVDDLSSVDVAIRAVGPNYGDNPKWTFRMLADRIWLNGASGLLDEATGLTHSVGTWYWARIRWDGSTVQGRTWGDGAGEPGTWTVEATDVGSPTSGDLILRVETDDTTADTALFDDLTLAELTGDDLGQLAGVAPLPTGALAGNVTDAGVLAGTSPMPAGAIPANVVDSGALAGTSPVPTGALPTGVADAGALAGVAPMPSGALPADVIDAGALAGTTPTPTGALVAGVVDTGTLAGTAPIPSGALAGTVAGSGALAGVTPLPVASLFAGGVVTGELAGDAPLPSGGLATVVTATSALVGVTPVPSGALAGGVVDPAALAAAAPASSGALAASVVDSGALAGVVPSSTGALAGTVAATGALAGVTSMPIGALGGGGPAAGVLAGVTPVPIGALSAVAHAIGVLVGVAPMPTGALFGAGVANYTTLVHAGTPALASAARGGVPTPGGGIHGSTPIPA